MFGQIVGPAATCGKGSGETARALCGMAVSSAIMDHEQHAPPDRREVVVWITLRAAEHGYPVNICEWAGGYGDTGALTWEEHLRLLEPAKLAPYHDALRRAVLARNLRRGGDWHQNAPDGIPVFDDGAIATFSYRAWGGLLAAIWRTETGHPFRYLDFYMDWNVEKAGLDLSPSGASRPC